MKAQKLSILLIEDSATDGLLFVEYLNQVVEFVFDVDTARLLSEGIKKLSDGTYNAVILDLGLPDSTGIDTLERVKSAAHGTPIIIFSGNEDRALLAEAMTKGADNYLIKGVVDGNRIAVAILSAIRNRLEQSES